MRLPIADCRLPIRKSFSRRCFTRVSHYGSKLVGFSQKRGKLALGHDPGLDKQFEPQCRLVGFFFDRPNLGDEFGVATCATTRTVISRHGGSTPHNLLGNHAPSIVVFWNRPQQFDDPQSKGFGTSFQFSWIHGSKLQTQSAIGNRQSAMAI